MVTPENNNMTFKEICQKFDASVLQQLYKKVTAEDNSVIDKNVFPVTLVQSIFDAISGMRLDDILSHYNYLHIQYKGSQASTRLAIPIAHRRKTLIISYVDYNNNIIVEQYIGETINDVDWQHEDNWKTPFTEGNFTVNVTDTQLEKYINQYFDDRDLSSIITNSIIDAVANFINSEEGAKIFNNAVSETVNNYLANNLTEDILKEIINQIIDARIKEIIIDYLNSDEGKELIREAIKPDLEEVVGEYFEAVKKYLEDNERVIANALARHEQAITDLQNS